MLEFIMVGKIYRDDISDKVILGRFVAFKLTRSIIRLRIYNGGIIHFYP